MPIPFRDRRDAGRRLAARLAHFASQSDVLILALPRGGVPVGYEVARSLGAPLDVFLVRKLGVPGHEELAMGAIATGGVLLVNDDVVQGLGLDQEGIDAAAAVEREELARRQRLYRGDRAEPDVRDRVVILVDDGLATGSSMRAAVAAVRRQQPGRVVVAVPVGAPDTCLGLRREVDEVVCARTPDPFWSVGQWYQDFTQ